MHWHHRHGKVKDSKEVRKNGHLKRHKIDKNLEKGVTENKSLLIMTTKFVFLSLSSLYHNRWIDVELKVF